MLGTLCATLALAGSVSAASARRLEVSARAFSVVWQEFTFSANEVNVSCHVTMEGSFHSRTFSKVSGGLVGYVTRAMPTGPSCSGFGFGFLSSTLPWHVRYASFAGLLPRIVSFSIQIIGLSFEVNAGQPCLYQSTASQPADASFQLNEAGTITSLRMDETAPIPKKEGGILCPESFTLRGQGTVRQLGSAEAIGVRLVS